VNGTIHAANATALQAKSDLVTYYNLLTSLPCTLDLTNQDLGNRTLTPGVYCFATSALMTGPLVLDAQGNAAALFVFRTGSTLTTASASSVTLINGGNRCGVNWRIGSSATLGTGTTFIGNLIALESITLTTAATIIGGRALARNAAVTLDTNTISTTLCAGPPPAPTPAPPVPTLTTWAAIALTGLLALGGMAALRRRQSAPRQPLRG
jgi:type VI secretion system secreted protein VgrG